MLTFKDKIVNILKYQKKVKKTVEDIKKLVEKKASDGYSYISDVYIFETPNNTYRSRNDGTHHYRISITDIGWEEIDNLIFSELYYMGFTDEEIVIRSVDLNPNPEFGQEGYRAAYILDINLSENL